MKQDGKIVWSSDGGDQRKGKEKDRKPERLEANVQNDKITLHLRRMTAGKGRAVIEITNLPANTKWCQDLAGELKKKLGVGGTFKNQMIEIHHEDMAKISAVLESKSLKWKKIGG